jgi:hypothetical protein
MNYLIIKTIMLLFVSITLSFAISMYYCGDIKRYLIFDKWTQLSLIIWVFNVTYGFWLLIYILMVDYT